MGFSAYVNYLGGLLWGWPMLFFIVGVGVVFTFSLKFVQFKYFMKSWTLMLFPPKGVGKKADMTPFQAFLNSLGASVGNGSIAGVSTAIASGGPGAAFWMIFVGFIILSIRFVEVYLGTFFSSRVGGKAMGGPIEYLGHVPGKKVLPYLYAFLCLMYGLVVGNSMQCNSIGVSVSRTLGINSLYIAALLTIFIFYILLGGAKRIIKISDRIIPIKMLLFVVPAVTLLVLHYNALIPALMLIFKSAFSTTAAMGGMIGISVQSAIRYGISRSLNANEIGLGTAPLLFGATGSDKPVESGILSMLSAFISTHVISFLVALSIVVAGVWNNGQTSTALLISAFETSYGNWGGWIVTVCAFSFGLGVLVTYSYIVRECWIFLTKGRFLFVANILYAIFAFFGTIGSVDVVWGFTDIINVFMLLVNLYGVIYLFPLAKKALFDYSTQK